MISDILWFKSFSTHLQTYYPKSYASAFHVLSFTCQDCIALRQKHASPPKFVSTSPEQRPGQFIQFSRTSTTHTLSLCSISSSVTPAFLHTTKTKRPRDEFWAMMRQEEDANSRRDADRIANSADVSVYKMSVAGCKS